MIRCYNKSNPYNPKAKVSFRQRKDNAARLKAPDNLYEMVQQQKEGNTSPQEARGQLKELVSVLKEKHLSHFSNSELAFRALSTVVGLMFVIAGVNTCSAIRERKKLENSYYIPTADPMVVIPQAPVAIPPEVPLPNAEAEPNTPTTNIPSLREALEPDNPFNMPSSVATAPTNPLDAMVNRELPGNLERKLSPEEFFETFAPAARIAGEYEGLWPSAFLAMMAYETGFGESVAEGGHFYGAYNIGGLKAHGDEPYVVHPRTGDHFIKFNSFEESIRYKADRIANNSIYAPAIAVSDNRDQFIDTLANIYNPRSVDSNGGSNYARTVKQFIEDYDLERFDVYRNSG